MRFSLFVVGLFISVLSVTAQTVVIDIRYQPSTKYQWSETYQYDNWSETFAEDWYKQSMEMNGIDASGKSKGIKRMVVNMTTDTQIKDYIPFTSVIIEKRDSSESERILFDNPQQQLETSDIIYYGKINRFQKLEIDSIVGTDSLYEKNKAFGLLDDIHRSISFPKDTFHIGMTVSRTKGFGSKRNGTFHAMQETTFTLIRIEGDMAYFDISINIDQPENDEVEERSAKIKGDGKGVLIYDLKNRIVSKYSYSRDTDQFYDYTHIANEHINSSTYTWTMEIME